MDLTAAMEAPCPPDELFGWVDDLARYPSWLGIVERAVPLAAGDGLAGEGLAGDGLAGDGLAGDGLVGDRVAADVAGNGPGSRTDVPPVELAWSVDLRGRLGPFARSKRLRMVRTALVPSALAVFERQETDQRRHAQWTLRAEVSARPHGGSALLMRLHYGGGLWGPVLERLLAEEVERGRSRLLALVST